MVALDLPMKKLVDNEGGTVSREIFCNQDIYDQEMEQIFARSWLFVGHESQIPRPGDFVLSRMGEEAVIVTRDRQNRVHVLLNSCRHRGNMVCRSDWIPGSKGRRRTAAAVLQRRVPSLLRGVP